VEEKKGAWCRTCLSEGGGLASSSDWRGRRSVKQNRGARMGPGLGKRELMRGSCFMDAVRLAAGPEWAMALVAIG
jgi:hypothetical protein